MHIELAHKARLTPAQDHYVEVLSCMERGRAGPRSVGRSASDIARFISMINPTGLNRKKGRDGERVEWAMLDRVTPFTPSFPPSLLPSSFAKNNPDLCSYGARAAPVRLSRDLGSAQLNSDVIANVGCNFANEKDPRGLNNTYWSRCGVLAPLFLPLKLCCVSKRRQDDGHGGRRMTDVTRSRNHH